MFKQLQALHGLLQYFKTYVACYDELMAPIVMLLSAPCPEWTSDHTATVVSVVTALYNNCELCAPDFNISFELHVSWEEGVVFATLC